MTYCLVSKVIEETLKHKSFLNFSVPPELISCITSWEPLLETIKSQFKRERDRLSQLITQQNTKTTSHDQSLIIICRNDFVISV